jgi:hypothetical protein
MWIVWDIVGGGVPLARLCDGVRLLDVIVHRWYCECSCVLVQRLCNASTQQVDCFSGWWDVRCFVMGQLHLAGNNAGLTVGLSRHHR